MTHTHLSLAEVRQFTRTAIAATLSDDAGSIVRLSGCIQVCDECAATVRGLCAVLLPPRFTNPDPNETREECLTLEELALVDSISENEHVAGCARCVLQFLDLRAMARCIEDERELLERELLQSGRAESGMRLIDEPEEKPSSPDLEVFTSSVILSLRPQAWVVVRNGLPVDGGHSSYRLTAAGEPGKRAQLVKGELSGAILEFGGSTVALTAIPPSVDPGSLVLCDGTTLKRPERVVDGAAHFSRADVTEHEVNFYVFQELSLRAELLRHLRSGSTANELEQILAAHLLGKLGSQAALPTLRHLVTRTKGRLQTALKNAIENIESPPA